MPTGPVHLFGAFVKSVRVPRPELSGIQSCSKSPSTLSNRVESPTDSLVRHEIVTQFEALHLELRESLLETSAAVFLAPLILSPFPPEQRAKYHCHR